MDGRDGEDDPGFGLGVNSGDGRVARLTVAMMVERRMDIGG